MRKSFSVVQAGLCVVLLFLISGDNFSQTVIQRPLKECGFLKTETLTNIAIASDNVKSLFLPLPDGLIKAVNVKNLETIWQSSVGGEINGAIFHNESSIFIASINNLGENEFAGKERSEKAAEKKISIQSIGTATGIPQWRKEFAVAADTRRVYILLSGNENTLYVLTENGALWILDKDDGQLKAEKKLGTSVDFPILAPDKKIYFGGAGNKIFAASNLQAETAVTEIAKLAEPLTALTADGSGELFAGDKLGMIYDIQTSGSKIKWRARSGAEITSIKTYADKVLVSSSDNYIYLLSKKSGSRIWKKRLEGKIKGELPFDTDFIIIAPLGTNTATVVNLKKGKTVNEITVGGKAENSFTGNPLIIGNNVIFSTVGGFYTFSADDCANDK